MHCGNINIHDTEAYLSLSKEPGWGVAFYLNNDHVRIYEQSLYLICALQRSCAHLVLAAQIKQSNGLVYGDLPLKSLYTLLDKCEVNYFDSGYGVRWLSDQVLSEFGFAHWRDQVLHSPKLIQAC